LFLIGAGLVLWGLVGGATGRDPVTGEIYDEMGHLFPFLIIFSAIIPFSIGLVVRGLRRK
jgi:hypothetical protein